jgi:hypothetical protein
VQLVHLLMRQRNVQKEVAKRRTAARKWGYQRKEVVHIHEMQLGTLEVAGR